MTLEEFLEQLEALDTEFVLDGRRIRMREKPVRGCPLVAVSGEDCWLDAAHKLCDHRESWWWDVILVADGVFSTPKLQELRKRLLKACGLEE